MRKSILIIGILAAVIAATLCFRLFNSTSDEKVQNTEETLRFKRKSVSGNHKRVVKGKRTSRISVRTAVKERTKPTFELDDDDEAKLTEEQKAILAEIRKALDEENKNEVLRLVQKLQRSNEWPDGIPKAIKMAAIEALGWFGSSCLPEIVGFLADADPEIIEATIERYEEALSDIELSDRERAQILIGAAKVIRDPEIMDQFMFELNDMRNSVAIDTIKQILALGSDSLKGVLTENIEFFTGEEGLDSPEKLDAWLKENPDGEDDEEFYGGSKEE